MNTKVSLKSRIRKELYRREKIRRHKLKKFLILSQSEERPPDFEGFIVRLAFD